MCYYRLLLLVALAQGQRTGQQSSYLDPCQTKSRLVAHESYCDKYYACVNGETATYDCENGLVFVGRGIGIIKPCDYDHNVDCSERPNRNPPIATDHCDWLYGIFGHETSCTRYWSCWNGTASEVYCTGGLLFNEEKKVCDWPQEVSGCQQHPLCDKVPNGNVPLGKSCERYWKCLGGYPRLHRCPAGLVFDKRALSCVPPPTEDCEVPTTPPPEIVEDEEFLEPLPPKKQVNRQPIRAGGIPNRRRQQQQQPLADEGPFPGAIPLNQPFIPQGAIPLGPIGPGGRPIQ